MTSRQEPTTIADVCCCAGLAADGYASVLGARALYGIDIDPQPDYPYDFTQADAIAFLESGMPEAYTALHTSFPCQLFTTAGHLRTGQGGKSKYPDLLTPGLALLRERWNHKPWIVENVEDNQGKVRAIMAPREGEHLILLCGSMFGLQVQRHRLFLANFPLRTPPPYPEQGSTAPKAATTPPSPLTRSAATHAHGVSGTSQPTTSPQAVAQLWMLSTPARLWAHTGRCRGPRSRKVSRPRTRRGLRGICWRTLPAALAYAYSLGSLPHQPARKEP